MINIAVGKPLPNTAGQLSGEARLRRLDAEWQSASGSVAPHAAATRDV